MSPVSSIDLLRIWEDGMDQSVTEKTLRLLAKACSVTDHHQIGRLSIGERDVRLLQLREWMFGTRLRNIATCPDCNETVEWEMTTGDLYMTPPGSGLSVRTFLLEQDDFIIRFRLPDTYDISRAVAMEAHRVDPKILLSDCILEINGEKKKEPLPILPDSVWEALDARMDQEDPQADIRMKIQCPACSNQWNAPFDIISFLWAEINNWAERVLREVYVLARAFGWAENDILTMTARRRQQYLQMLGA